MNHCEKYLQNVAESTGGYPPSRGIELLSELCARVYKLLVVTLGLALVTLSHFCANPDHRVKWSLSNSKTLVPDGVEHLLAAETKPGTCLSQSGEGLTALQADHPLTTSGIETCYSAGKREQVDMSSQPQPDVNTLLHNMHAQILLLITQLSELQTNPPEAVEQKFNKKVEIVADRAWFAKWWIKLQIWIKVNWDTFTDDFEIATAMLSILKGPVGNMRTDDFVTQLLALSIQGGLEQLYLQDMRNKNLSQAAEEVRKIGRAVELYTM
ncbi:hypothetical protein SERLA73DRAFT_149099 [Serpula lacrymans var. lacrymans S7.3]|uniref:Uncharacterized protein n=1 Tax=Serpula lacrymans var. lacrymans (strain S7.3) TaxID=936435 RepID=F8PF17_SERL3|nr:hypothetical protein SERLA73DRAFT_149099 [Serpula lacrymans var. lacrymans S7.3]